MRGKVYNYVKQMISLPQQQQVDVAAEPPPEEPSSSIPTIPDGNATIFDDINARLDALEKRVTKLETPT